MAVNGVSSNNNAPTVVDKDKTGFNGVTSDVFMKLLITQLQNQDPTQPVGNDELLQQLSTMRNLQANIELSDTLKSTAAIEKLSAGSSFLGKEITGFNKDLEEVRGVADRIFFQDGETRLGIGNESVSISTITSVNIIPPAAA